MIDFLLPSLGADMDRAKLNMWLVSPGDEVHRGQIIAEVETEKSVLEVECWEEGIVEELLVQPGAKWLPVGTPLARIRPVEVQVTAGAVEAPRAPPPSRAVRPPSPPSRAPSPPLRHLAHELGVDLATVSGSGPDGAITREDIQRAAGKQRPTPVPGAPPWTGNGRVKASPLARVTAQRLGVDLSSVAPSGPGGLITAADVESTGEAAAEPEDRVRTMRRAIARSMSHSKREIPHYYLATTIDLDRALRWLEARNEEKPIAERMLPAVLLLKATAVAASRFTDLNGHWIDDGYRPSAPVHLGVAVSIREGGLVAPAIHDADGLSLDELMTALRDLVTRARSWRLRSSEMSDPTITVTNLGERGVETAFPIIIPPQVAMVGFGKTIESVSAVDGKPVIRPVVHASLAGDHRVTDGHRGGLFLAEIDRLLQEPEEL